MAAQQPNATFMPPNSQFVSDIILRDIEKNLSSKEIQNLWLYFRNYDIGGNFGNYPPIGDIGLWAMCRKYVLEYVNIIKPLFIQLLQFQNGQLIFYSNDMSDDTHFIDKNGNTFIIGRIESNGNEYQQYMWDLLLTTATEIAFHGRIILCILISY